MHGKRKIDLDGIADRLQHEFRVESEPLSVEIATSLERLHDVDNRATTLAEVDRND